MNAEITEEVAREILLAVYWCVREGQMGVRWDNTWAISPLLLQIRNAYPDVAAEQGPWFWAQIEKHLRKDSTHDSTPGTPP